MKVVSGRIGEKTEACDITRFLMSEEKTFYRAEDFPPDFIQLHISNTHTLHTAGFSMSTRR